MEKICFECGQAFSKSPKESARQWDARRYCSLKCNGHRPMGYNLQSEFDDRYIPEPNSGCWIWIGAVWKLPSGDRGKFATAPGLQRSAYQVSYEMHIGPIPAGLWICHKCNTPICVNPDHLYAGTPADNSADMHGRGRAWKTPDVVARMNRRTAA